MLVSVSAHTSTAADLGRGVTHIVYQHIGTRHRAEERQRAQAEVVLQFGVTFVGVRRLRQRAASGVWGWLECGDENSCLVGIFRAEFIRTNRIGNHRQPAVVVWCAIPLVWLDSLSVLRQAS